MVTDDPSASADGDTVAGDSTVTVIVVLEVIIYIVGFIGNILVIFVITFLKEYKKIPHWYLLQLSLADFLFLNTIPFKVLEMIRGSWDYSVSTCRGVQALLYLNYYASVLFLMVMAFDRYTAVCHPLSPRVGLFRTPAFCYWVTAAIWVISLALCTPVVLYSDKAGFHPNCGCSFNFPRDIDAFCRLNPKTESRECSNRSFTPPQCLYGGSNEPLTDADNSILVNAYQHYELRNASPAPHEIGGMSSGDVYRTTSPYRKRTEPDTDSVACGAYDPFRPGWKIFTYFNFSVMFLLPLLVISICYGFIIVEVTKRKEIHTGKFLSVRGQRRKVVNEGKRVTMVCGLLVVCFILCWLPFHSWHIAKTVGISNADKSLCNRIAVAIRILAFINSMSNPFIYNFFGKHFRSRISQIRLRRRKGKWPKLTGSTPTNSTATTSMSSRNRSARL